MKYETFKGIEAVVLENEAVKCTFLPSYGGKLASFYDKRNEYEWLFQAEEENLRIPEYGSDFSLYDSSGFDEVFPSIDETFHPTTGEIVPDHGEVWALPWEVEEVDHGLQFTVKSSVFPYELIRTVTLEEEGLQFDYRAVNNGPLSFPFIWTPHCLLNMNEYTKIEVPSGLEEVITVEHGTKHLGEWGTRHTYPFTKSLSTGEEMDLSKVAPIESGTCEKFYFTKPLPEGWCAVKQHDLGTTLRYEFPHEKIPYLGVWKTEGGYRGHYNMALEPCTGIYDDVYVAKKIRKVTEIPPNGEYTWEFRMKLLK
ncbi:DUF5107 domain-containing protein [Mangrovibacillus cuniculi]|uniref:DUF5107 domain-containing protein n=1 Tax=Mangrovibacillus cuniculi TaxID=2593652 RepID=A0A7S8C8W7_9BACI|nr:DUF5107 domain-containing protein [Mangrovibacillus cuniculi]QPC45539.1 DUF5107 domain-containing protein [Mangrovibacillus cuniculi]